MAQQLTREGDEVSLVILVHPDARAPMHLGFRAMRRLAILGGLNEDIHFAEFSGPIDYTITALRKILAAQRQLPPAARTERLLTLLRWLRSFAVKNARRPGAMLKAFRSRGPRGGDVIVQDQMRWAAGDKPLLGDTGNPGAQAELVAHAEHMANAWTRYNPQPYHGPVAILWPVKGPANPPWNPRALWNRLAPNHDWHFVPGNHWSMLHKHFEKSARVLGDSVARASKPK
jgi:hypothetical protein